MVSKLLTVEQAAEILQVHPLTVYKWLRTGTIPGIQIGRTWRVKEDELENFLNKGGAPRKAAKKSGKARAKQPKPRRRKKS